MHVKEVRLLLLAIVKCVFELFDMRAFREDVRSHTYARVDNSSDFKYNASICISKDAVIYKYVQVAAPM